MKLALGRGTVGADGDNATKETSKIIIFNEWKRVGDVLLKGG